MNNIKKILGVTVAAVMLAAAGLGMHTGVSARAEETEAQTVTYSVKNYTPDHYDFVDYYGAVGDIAPEDGDGITTFAHAGLTTPLKGEAIEFNTSFKLLSKNSVENGGDGVDGWVTYSFSKTPAEKTDDNNSDKTFPYYGGAKDGIFFHITNYSGTAAPNCVEMQIVQSKEGVTTEIWTPATGKFVDNIIDVRMTFSLAKGENGKYTLTLKKMTDGAELKKIENLELDESLFINENGQTYFSTAIYEGPGCDGEHFNHRGLSVYNLKAYNADITEKCVTLSATEYTFEEGGTYRPDVTVTVGAKQLVKGEDFDVTYENNDAVGTATAKIVFYGEYGGNAVEKTYTIKAAEKPEESGDDESESGEPSTDSEITSETSSETAGDNPTGSETSKESNGDKEQTESGCFGGIGGMTGIAMMSLAIVAGAILIVRKKSRN